MTSSRIGDIAGKLMATIRFSTGGAQELEVLDLSHGGCMVDRRRAVAAPGSRVLVKLPGLSYQPGEVVWVEDAHAGIAFEQPLHEAVLDHLRRTLHIAPKAA